MDIYIRLYAPDKWTGVYFADQQILRQLTGSAYFLDDDYDDVLAIVSKYGYWLMYDIELADDPLPWQIQHLEYYNQLMEES